MPILRTPDERFANLPGYSFKPHYLDFNGARAHYVDEGQGEVVLLLHGEPSWSFLYRKMIPPLASRFRVLAPDFIGFGKSDKFSAVADYTFQLHRDMLAHFLDALNLTKITLVVQDWGGPIGLWLVGEMPARFARLVIMNTGLPTGEGRFPRALVAWREYVASTPDLPIGRVIRGGTTLGDALPDDIVAAYDAPFPDATYKAGTIAFPALIPTMPAAAGAAAMRQAKTVLAQWAKPALIMFSDQDPITRGGDGFFHQLMPHATVIPIEGAGHFLQEEKGEDLAAHILANF